MKGDVRPTLWEGALPAAELVGLPARDERLREVAARLVSGPSEHKRIQRLELAQRAARRKVRGPAAVNSHGP